MVLKFAFVAPASCGYSGVGAHHQNGIAKSSVKQFTLSGRTLLLHAKRHWPEAITTMLWPFALKAAIKFHNDFYMDTDGKIPMELFSGVDGMETAIRD